MNWKSEWKPLAAITAVFLAFFFLPIESERFTGAVIQSLELAKWYAREHVILCLVPAFFIAGAIGVFISQNSVMKYLGARANKAVAYGVASMSGGILAVCSCTVLPLFAGIYRMGAGIGPATAFLYSGPAINVLAIILTARILGFELGVARAAGAVLFSIVIGLIMEFVFRGEEKNKAAAIAAMPEEDAGRPLWKNALFFGLLVAILVFANWGKPESAGGMWAAIYSIKWLITAAAGCVLGVLMVTWFGVAWWKMAASAAVTAGFALVFAGYPLLPFSAAIVTISISMNTEEGEASEWFYQTWDFAKQIMPLLFYGVLAAGFLLGMPGGEGVIPSEWVNSAVGGNSIWANLFASFAGAFMYFATLTEIPILQGLLDAGMGKGPALALLLAGPALSLPNMLVIRSVLGTRKTAVLVILVVVMATISGFLFGNLFG